MLDITTISTFQRTILAAILAIGFLMITPADEARAGDDSGSGTNYYAGLSCGQLWYERNRIFAARGLCFKTRRAKRAFPNSCFAPYGKLPGHLARTVRSIKSWERRRGC